MLSTVFLVDSDSDVYSTFGEDQHSAVILDVTDKTSGTSLLQCSYSVMLVLCGMLLQISTL